jgi:hypothetical protein
VEIERRPHCDRIRLHRDLPIAFNFTGVQSRAIRRGGQHTLVAVDRQRLLRVAATRVEWQPGFDLRTAE